MCEKIAKRLSLSMYRKDYVVNSRQGLESHISTAIMLSLCFLIFVLQGVVDCVVDCRLHGDGIYQITCHSYTSCTNGISTDHTCANGQMYSPVLKRCASTTNLAPPCNVNHTCSGQPNKRFADQETHCQTYYTCQNEYFYGHSFCSPGTVFDEKMQNCNWPANVEKPCGTIDPKLVG
ncbi:uncharacterized protein LOC110448010 [Mizuhopecten yessoensis]|uniref:uncharacterized protein LOC110448010 n=1 Tax=Mizuhopecten yessoensis TaxID=6573 RepID=UPI000B45EECE|nr:uncharacterized protein LOC110448010 [Mizuhopecten yessoensis]